MGVGWIFIGFLVYYVVFYGMVLVVVWVYVYYLIVLVFFGDDWGWIFIVDCFVFFDVIYNLFLLVKFVCYVFVDK